MEPPRSVFMDMDMACVCVCVCGPGEPKDLASRHNYFCDVQRQKREPGRQALRHVENKCQRTTKSRTPAISQTVSSRGTRARRGNVTDEVSRCLFLARRAKDKTSQVGPVRSPRACVSFFPLFESLKKKGERADLRIPLISAV